MEPLFWLNKWISYYKSLELTEPMNATKPHDNQSTLFSLAIAKVRLDYCRVMMRMEHIVWNSVKNRQTTSVLSPMYEYPLWSFPAWISYRRDPMATINLTIYNIICWFAVPMGQMTCQLSVWNSKYLFSWFLIDLGHSQLSILIFCNFIKKYIKRFIAKNFVRFYEKK